MSVPNVPGHNHVGRAPLKRQVLRGPPNGRWTGVMISGAIGFSAKSAGPLKRKNLLSYCLRKIDQGELLLVE
jgi:hypothetical protein